MAKAAPKTALDKQIAKIKANTKLTAKQKNTAIAQARAKAKPKPAPAAPIDYRALASQYSFAAATLENVPELKAVFERAASGKLVGSAAITAAIQNTNWFRTHSEASRGYDTLRGSDPTQFQQLFDQQKEVIRRAANSLGARLEGASLDQLTEQARRAGGWSDQSGELRSAISHYISFSKDSPGDLSGEAGDLQDALRQKGAEYGVNLDDNFYVKAAQSVASGDSTERDWIDYVQNEAAKIYTPWAKQIQSGQTTRNLASTYIKSMSSILEIPEEQIGLDDPTLRKAILASNEQGEQAVAPPWKFEQQLRQDPRWERTKSGQQTLANVGDSIAKSWGLIQ